MRFAPYLPSERGQPPLDVRVALLSERDLQDVALLYADREGLPHAEARAWWQRAWDRRRAPSGKTTFVARTCREGALVGYGSVQHISPGRAPGSRTQCPAGFYLAGLVIAEHVRRRGIGSALVERRLAWLERRAAECFYVANERNQATDALHQRFGFVELARDVWLPGVTFDRGAGLLFRRSRE